MKRVLIVSPYFPPSTHACVHRPRHLAKYLPRHGWEAVVFCVHEKYHEEKLDRELAALVPPGVRVVKTGAFPAPWTRLCGLGDISLRSFCHMKQALARFMNEEGADLVFVSVPPFYTSLIGAWMKKKYRIPFVVDYIDPWVCDWGAGLPKWSKGGISHQIARYLEPKTVVWADHITSVSQGTNDLLRRFYPHLRKEIFSAMPIAIDPDDYIYLRQHDFPVKSFDWDSSRFNFSSVGAFLPRSGETYRALLKAWNLLNSKRPGLCEKGRLNFVGTSNQPNGFTSYKMKHLAEEEGVGAYVREVPQRVPYLEALKILSLTDVILMLGSDEKHYTASRLYPALYSGRPILALYHEASSVCQVARRTGGVRLVEFSDSRPVGSCVGQIASALEDLIVNPGSVLPPDPQGLADYSADEMAGQYARVFDRVLKRAGGVPAC